jgi:hypothetical protein
VNNTPGAELLGKRIALGIINMLGLFFCVQVIEIAKEFIKDVIVRQVLVEITQVIFTTLPVFYRNNVEPM